MDDRYCTIEEVEQMGGLGNDDFMQGDHMMSSSEYESFMDSSILWCGQIMHRYCNVETFFEKSVTEYHNGRVETGSDEEATDYEKTFYTRVFPCTEINAVYVDTADVTSASKFELREERSEGNAGTYIPMIEFEMGSVYFTSHIPSKGYKNVKLIYTSGYSENSIQFKELKLICIRLVRNLQLLKKKEQEASTIRNSNIRDYAQMFDMYSASEILTGTIATELERYRVKRIPCVGGFS